MRKRMFIRKDEEGVSPVIATILMVAITVVLAAVLYIMVFGFETRTIDPAGSWGSMKPKGATAVDAEFGTFSQDVSPVNLEILLVRNGTAQGKYSFPDNEDGQLTLSSGDDVGTLTYEDYMNNKKVNSGDKIAITNLTPGSDYTIMMFWGPSGNRLASADFSTPGL